MTSRWYGIFDEETENDEAKYPPPGSSPLRDGIALLVAVSVLVGIACAFLVCLT